MNTVGNAPFNVTRCAASVAFAVAFWNRYVDWDSITLKENMVKFALREQFIIRK